MEALLKQSIVNALADPEHTWQYVRQHAQEMELDILQKHIQMFVNSFSLDLGQIGRDAISTLDKMASRAGALT
jgi:1,4-dihydroxy-6-naphthoate synthase